MCFSFYSKLLDRNESVVKNYASNLNKAFKEYNNLKIIRLSEDFRRYTSMAWYNDWSDVNLHQIRDIINNEEEYLTVLKLGSFHPNGYYREKCLKEMVNYEGVLPYVLLRVNDWVPKISNLAFLLTNTIMMKSSKGELFQSLAFLYKLYNGQRYNREKIDTLMCRYKEILIKNIVDDDLAKINKLDDKGKRMFYILIKNTNVLEKNKIKKLLSYEKNPIFINYLIDELFENYDCSEEDINELLKSKSGRVRLKAIMYNYKKLNGLWDECEKFLLDKSFIVRDSMQFLIKKEKRISSYDYYISNLTGDNLIIAIIGIGEVGSSSDLELLKKYLESDNERVIKVALESISKLAGDKESDLYWKYLNDERVILSNIAYRAIIGNKVFYGGRKIYNEILNNSNKSLKDKLVKILIKESYWDRIGYLLLLVDYEDEDIRLLIHNRLIPNNKSFVKPTENQKKFIETSIKIKESLIPDYIKERIIFELKL